MNYKNLPKPILEELLRHWKNERRINLQVGALDKDKALIDSKIEAIEKELRKC